MNAPQKGLEVDLKEIGCPYPPEDPRTSIYIDAYFKGQLDGMERGAKAISEVYDRHLTKAAGQ